MFELLLCDHVLKHSQPSLSAADYRSIKSLWSKSTLLTFYPLTMRAPVRLSRFRGWMKTEALLHVWVWRGEFMVLLLPSSVGSLTGSSPASRHGEQRVGTVGAAEIPAAGFPQAAELRERSVTGGWTAARWRQWGDINRIFKAQRGYLRPGYSVLLPLLWDQLRWCWRTAPGPDRAAGGGPDGGSGGSRTGKVLTWKQVTAN